MAKKFKIAQNPTFKAKVGIPRVGADDIEVEFEYKFLPRKQLAEMYDSWRAESSKLEVNDDTNLSDLTAFEVDLQVQQLKEILVGWNFDDEFNEDNIRALVETSVGATKAIIAGFQESYSKSKLGN